MHPEIARTLARQHSDELTRQAERQRVVAAARGRRHRLPHMRVPHYRAPQYRAPQYRLPRYRLPRYRVHWSRTTLSPAGLPGRHERSWVIVISATRGV